MKSSVASKAILLILLISLCISVLKVNAQGGGWTIVPNPTTGGAGVVSIFMLDANDGWALCEYPGSEFPRSEIIRWNGETWNLVENPIEVYPMSDLCMVSASDGWAVGGWGGIIRWDGAKWTNFTSPTASWMRSLDMISPNDGWAVGHAGVTIHWDGNNWSEVASPTTVNLLAVNMVSASDVWAVGEGGTIIRWDGENWSIAALSPNRETLNDVFMLDATDGWIVGGNWGTSDSGSILRWDGENWNPVESPTTIALFSVDAITANDVWAVGGNWNIPNGIIVHWDGVKWSIVTSPPGITLRSVFMLDASNGWAGGTDGTTLHWTGKMPVASFSTSGSLETGDSITFDGSDSEDADGSVIGYDWDFGDGNTGTGVTTTHSYTSDGTYTVTLTVTDNDGLVDTIQKTITIIQPSPKAPEASFTSSPSSPQVDETVNFDASGSSDPAGNIISYDWNFGDGNIGAGMTTTHSYSSAGTYTVTLTVADNDGLTGTATKTITVTTPGSEPEPEAPEASFTSSHEAVSVNDPVTFDASDSSDSDGTIVDYAWDFGDGNTGTDMTTTHSYDSEGTYTVELTVTDNDGQTATAQAEVTVVLPNVEDVTPPVANAGNDKTATAGSEVTFSAAGSSDDSGIINYSWDFGDGTTGTGETITHTYENEGIYYVSLTVIDTGGLSSTDTLMITVEKGATAGFPYWILIPIIIAAVAVAIVVWFFLKKRKPKEKVPKPVKLRIIAEPTEILADGKTKSAITVELLDEEGNPVPALENTEIKLTTTKGKIEKPVVKISRGKESEKTLLISPKESGTAILSANVEDLGSTSITVTFMEKKRYCMHCGSKMSFGAKRCLQCGKSPPAGVDTKSCENCNAVIPVVAKFCAECGARQPKQDMKY